MRRLVDLTGLRRLETEKPSVPKDTAVFAIGDVNGRLDLMVQMHQQIHAQAASLSSSIRKTLVYLGNYVGIGPHSADVIDTLLSVCMPGFRVIYLMGEHEHHFMNFLKGKVTSRVKQWLYEGGGLQTLASYGVDTTISQSPKAMGTMRVELLRKIPTDHLTFLENLQLSHSSGDFFFVHAGVDPSRPLNEQNPSDLLTIGEGFLDCRQVLDKVVIHGHTAYKTPCIRTNRIGLNTAAHESGQLSGIIIVKDNYRIIQT